MEIKINTQEHPLEIALKTIQAAYGVASEMLATCDFTQLEKEAIDEYCKDNKLKSTSPFVKHAVTTLLANERYLKIFPWGGCQMGDIMLKKSLNKQKKEVKA